MLSSIRRSCPVLAAAGFFVVLATGSSAWSQQETVYIGGPAKRGTVQVDMSVLDDLGRGGQTAAPGRAPAGQHVTLTPPSQKKAATQHKSATKAKPVTTRKAPAPTTKVAAPTETAKATPASTPAELAPAPQPATPTSLEPQAKAASADVPLAPPEPIEIAMPPAAPAPAAPKALAAVAAAAAVTPAAAKGPETPTPTSDALPRDMKPAPSPAPAMAAKEPAPAPEPSPSPLSAAAAVVVPAAAPIAADPAPAAAPTPKTTSVPTPKTTSVPKPEPVAQPVSAPESEATQTAALMPAPQSASAATAKQSMRISFPGGATTLPEPSKTDLKDMAGSLSKDPALRVQVMAYASGSDDAGKARRLSLSRALAVRSYLIEQGIGSTRIDVRALGNAAEGGPADRVDLMVLSR